MDWMIHGTGNQFFSSPECPGCPGMHPSFYWVGRGIFSSLGIKELGHEADYLPVFSAHVMHRVFDMLIIWIFEIGYHDLPFCFNCTILHMV